MIENTTTGQKVSKDLTSSAALCEENAEWIVEDYEENGALVPLANFGTVTFTGADGKSFSQNFGRGKIEAMYADQLSFGDLASQLKFEVDGSWWDKTTNGLPF